MAIHKRGKTVLRNRLWQARKCRGFSQKQVSKLLRHKKINQLSRFEKSVRLPSLRNALALEIIYGMPVRALFSGLYVELQGELRKRAGHQTRPLIKELFASADANAGLDCCACEELLRSPVLSQAERDRIRDHVVHLARQLAHL